ncbi:hypothetical protein [Siminovitchia fortis]|uniref:hypothetical protein n=1 Tax=Siminovitchia fortis TaxID=254758 RepID=UPI0011A99538|nr:hypothetical protein [Siminovitchia fortis]
MSPNVKGVLHALSVLGTFMTTFALLYLVQKYTIGLLFSLNKIEFYGLPIHILIYTSTSLYIMKKFIKISSPYKDDF